MRRIAPQPASGSLPPPCLQSQLLLKPPSTWPFAQTASHLHRHNTSLDGPLPLSVISLRTAWLSPAYKRPTISPTRDKNTTTPLLTPICLQHPLSLLLFRETLERAVSALSPVLPQRHSSQAFTSTTPENLHWWGQGLCCKRQWSHGLSRAASLLPLAFRVAAPL